MKKDYKGITLAGNILVDVVKQIDSYPNIGMLANIQQTSRSVGGCVPNTGIGGDFTYVPSLNVPKSEIIGTVGAGDAFCAGSLYSIYNGYIDRHILEFAAACSLLSENAVDGMKRREEIERTIEKYGWENLAF